MLVVPGLLLVGSHDPGAAHHQETFSGSFACEMGVASSNIRSNDLTTVNGAEA